MNQKDYDLFDAVTRGDVDAMLTAIGDGADVSAVRDGWETPLHIATAKRDIELVWVLLDCGADVNAGASIGNTPVRVLTDDIYNPSDLEIILLLVAHGANLDVPRLRSRANDDGDRVAATPREALLRALGSLSDARRVRLERVQRLRESQKLRCSIEAGFGGGTEDADSKAGLPPAL